MTTWREAIAARAERQRRETSYYKSPSRRGRACAVCKKPMDRVLSDCGDLTHPVCDPASADLMARVRPS